MSIGYFIISIVNHPSGYDYVTLLKHYRRLYYQGFGIDHEDGVPEYFFTFDLKRPPNFNRILPLLPSGTEVKIKIVQHCDAGLV